MRLFSEATKIRLITDLAEETYTPKDNANTMLRGKFRIKINFLAKIIGLLLLMYFALNALRIRKRVSDYPVEIINVEENKQSIRNVLEKLQNHDQYRDTILTACPIPKLKNTIGALTKSNLPKCQRVSPVKGSCDAAQSLFFDKPKGTCSHQKQTHICHITGNTREVVCQKGMCKHFHLGIRSVETGRLEWRDVETSDRLKNEIGKLLITKNNGYCYIKCQPENEGKQDRDYLDLEQESDDSDNVQLLILPPFVQLSKMQLPQKHLVNVNFIFIDSVSRHHFYRSLPDTVKLFEQVNAGGEAIVLDYSLVQAVRSRTFETFNSLLAGYIPEGDRTFGVLDMPSEPLKIEGLFGLFRDAGYRTLWLEDLCFEWEWGISKDLLVHNKSLTTEETWKNLNKAFKKAAIDSFGMSSANCEILSHNGVNDHFHGPDTVCFNGRHQHDYHLEYLRFYQEAMISSNQCFLSLLETNVGHEDTGRRIQTLDKELADYLKFAGKQENTLTILFSDHGNAYGDFIQTSSEGRVETYQPAMFLIIPQSLRQQFGTTKMAALTLNQNRLISHLDLHYTVNSLVSRTSGIPHRNKKYQVTESGLFENISKSRQCSDMPQIPPNLCICEGGESRIANTSQYVLYAHFAVGTINNAIQSQFRHSHPSAVTGFGRCRRLELVSFQHVRKTDDLDGTKTLTMDILFETADPTYHHNEVFMVSVVSERKTGHMTLNKFDRISPYSKYSACVDSGVQLQLCICELSKPRLNLMPLTDAGVTNDALLMKSDVDKVDGSKDCLVRINQQSKEGFMILLLNVCTSVQIHVTLTLTSDNMDISHPKTQQCSVRPGEVRFMIAGVVSDLRLSFDWSYTLHFVIERWP